MLDLPVLAELVVLTLASWRLTRLVVVDDFPPVEWLRDKLTARWPAPDTVFPDLGQVIPDEAFPSEGVIVQGGRRVPVVWSDQDEGWVALEPHWVGKLITCPWCVGFWITAVVVAGWALAPVSLWLWLVLAMAGLVGILSQVVDG